MRPRPGPLLLAALLSPAAAAAQGFPALADAVLTSPPFNGATVGAIFISLSDATTPYAKNENLPLPPASVAKLAVSGAALESLKPDFRFKTSLLALTKEKDAAKLSVLVWRGRGDPSISGRDRSGLSEIFDVWGASLAARGVREIGRMALDERYFEGPALVASWPKGELSYWYAAETSPISFNDNCVNLTFSPGAKPGRRAKIALEPDFGYLKAADKAETGPAGSAFTLDFRRGADSNRAEFFGSIPADASTRPEYVAVHRPAFFAADSLRGYWRSRGPRILKPAVAWPEAGLEDGALTEIFAWQSPPLSSLIKIINTNSQNFYAEQLLKTLGKEVEGRGSFEAGRAVVSRFLRRAGLADADFRLVDGSGLSGEDRLSAAGVARILRFMHASPYAQIYSDSLAVPGVDKSAKRRMGASPLSSRMRLKPGKIANARNLAGTLESKSGRLYAFAVLVERDKLDRQAVDDALDRLCVAAADLLP